ncbi:MAG TPA: hypothetical protein VFV34_25985 [Blastocatellia bacterium]|nr:hypothetical protein [Blastocatellia bacterium]
MLRRLKICVIAAAAVTGFTLSQSAIGAKSTQHVDIRGRAELLADRVGTGDGVALIVQFMGDVHGSIDACG